jgi:hypothetical protein
MTTKMPKTILQILETMRETTKTILKTKEVRRQRSTKSETRDVTDEPKEWA